MEEKEKKAIWNAMWLGETNRVVLSSLHSVYLLLKD